MAKSLPIKLSSLYLTQGLEHESFMKILGDRNPSVFFRMMYIANGVKERQEFLELNDREKERYYLIAAIYTRCNLLGEAKEQFNKTIYKNRMNYSPHYRIRLLLTDKLTNRDIIDFEYITSKQKDVYDMIPRLENKINKVLWKID